MNSKQAFPFLRPVQTYGLGHFLTNGQPQAPSSYGGVRLTYQLSILSLIHCLMRTFTIIWFGQLVSTIGSYMTEFALTLWAWEVTGSATALALVGFFSQLSRIPITVFAGLIVDWFNRKQLMILGDTIALLSFSYHNL
jgi:hypothetical protein